MYGGGGGWWPRRLDICNFESLDIGYSSTRYMYTLSLFVIKIKASKRR